LRAIPLSVTGQDLRKRVLDFPWIVYTADPVYELETVHGTIERLGLAPEIRIRSQSLIATLAFLQKGDFLCVLPESAVVGATAPRIVPVPVNPGAQGYPFGCPVSRRDRRLAAGEASP
jgi:DNA-binding transcriptional LysR family regulator